MFIEQFIKGNNMVPLRIHTSIDIMRKIVILITSLSVKIQLIL